VTYCITNDPGAQKRPLIFLQTNIDLLTVVTSLYPDRKLLEKSALRKGARFSGFLENMKLITTSCYNYKLMLGTVHCFNCI
jgi:hypothetical protein